MKKINKKALKMPSELVIFRAFFFFFKYLQKKNSKPSVKSLNILAFPKNLDRTITFNSVTFKNTQTKPQKYIIFFSMKQIIFRVGRLDKMYK